MTRILKALHLDTLVQIVSSESNPKGFLNHFEHIISIASPGYDISQKKSTSFNRENHTGTLPTAIFSSLGKGVASNFKICLP